MGRRSLLFLSGWRKRKFDNLDFGEFSKGNVVFLELTLFMTTKYANHCGMGRKRELINDTKY